MQQQQQYQQRQQQRQRQNKLVSDHVTEWFHRIRSDDISPAIAVRQMCNLFIRHMRSCGLDLSIDETRFRKYMCEATCTMYVSYKQGTGWVGPNSKMIRPTGWTRQLETEWQEHLQHHYFPSTMWYGFWEQITGGEIGMWETHVPNWRISMQSILLHYIQVKVSDLFLCEKN